jgi:hypothetical protein
VASFHKRSENCADDRREQCSWESRNTYSNISAGIHLQLAHLYFHEYSGNLSNHISQRFVSEFVFAAMARAEYIFIPHFFLSIL